MTSDEWRLICDGVATHMLAYTAPFVTPLATPTTQTIRQTGTGSYVMMPDDRRILLTCEHVARHRPVHYRFKGSENVFEHRGTWKEDRHSVDVSYAYIDDAIWTATNHQADEIRTSLFSTKHHLIHCEELIFFRGFAGENSRYAFGVHQTDGTGYCSQEVKGGEDCQIFEIFWEPQKTQFASGTPAEIKSAVKYDDAGGFSGSLVWNTRYLEVTRAGQVWSPKDAVVTGMLRRWDTKTKSLLALRIEHLRAWLGI